MSLAAQAETLKLPLAGKADAWNALFRLHPEKPFRSTWAAWGWMVTTKADGSLAAGTVAVQDTMTSIPGEEAEEGELLTYVFIPIHLKNAWWLQVVAVAVELTAAPALIS